jgi:hypothetical protein
MLIQIGESFMVELTRVSVYLKAGSREWFWSQREGFVSG